MSIEANIRRAERARRRGSLDSSTDEFLFLYNEFRKPRTSKFRKFLSIVSCGLIEAGWVLEDDEFM